MRRKPLCLSGMTTIERHRAIAAVSDAISAGGGWIVDHTLFSNIMATIRFAIPFEGLEVLKERCNAAGIKLDADTPAELEQAGTAKPRAQGEINASLTLTFVHNEPDLRIEIPAVPG
ncbi:hypothetical protein AZL_a09260 (plasmid) [Azospirillum sp. B510]|uniref:hypothetical protein n=1 Tax=Azospirillum sp. (strain B510) TaxID=137722 RepID=UPI0001C4BBFF|nr:hypothetical protein [Azospirillum sp. B510]BAI74457.1 hypothetical protein AZL_a09260 [Azospirillum sp. B510]